MEYDSEWTDRVMQEYLDDPRRVSVLAPRLFQTPAKLALDRVGLWVDFKLNSLWDLERQEVAIRRDGLGVLAVFGFIPESTWRSGDMADFAPFQLQQLGIENTLTVYVPFRRIPENLEFPLEEAGFTRILDISDFYYLPGRIYEEGARLVREVVDLQPVSVE